MHQYLVWRRQAYSCQMDTVQVLQLAVGEEVCFELFAIEITPGVRVIKLGRVRWAGQVARMGER